MHRLTVSRWRASVLVAGLGAAVVAGGAYAAAGGGSQVASACVDSGSGELYVASPCRAGDRSVALGAGATTGPRGKAGRTGKTGARGLKGDTGAVGSKGDTGAVGPKGDTGATGSQGSAGRQGVPGPQGVPGADGAGAYVTDRVPQPLSTSSTTATDLGGPAVTVTVPSSGLVEIYAGEASAGTGGHSDVFLYEDGNPVTAIECDGSTPGLIIADDPTSAGTVSTTGTSANATTTQCGTDGGGVPISLTVNAGPGSHTFKLEYAIVGGQFSTTFTNSFLSVATRA